MTRKITERDRESTNIISPTEGTETAPGKTRIYGAENEQPDDFMADPVVGWLVVVKGPGKGCALRLGYGENTLGRAADQVVCLDFGESNTDECVSSTRHAVVTYYARERLFRVRHDLGRNPTYLNGAAVLQPTELKSGDIIMIGDTEIRFVPLCGEDFDWNSDE